MTIRAQQVGSIIRESVQMSLARGLQDPRIRGLISVTEVEVTPDLAEAFISVSVLPAEQGPLTVRGLQHASSRLRTQASRLVRMRSFPRLTFRLDESLKRQAAIDLALRADQMASDAPDDDFTSPAEEDGGS